MSGCWSGQLCSFFFFQAEDGIRDGTVTGVQTCALPILSKVIEDRRHGSSRRNTAISTATVSAADLPASRAASTKRVLRSLSTSTSTGRVRRQISRSPSQRSEERRVGKGVRCRQCLYPLQ